MTTAVKQSTIPYRRLGRTGLEVSAIGFGCMGFGGKDRWIGGVGDAEAERLVQAALDRGVNLFDTADVYNVGQSEEILARALGKRRQQAVIATKVFCRMGKGPNSEGLSRHHILESVDASLRRLKTDYIDLYQAHEWDERTPIEETVRAFDDLVRWGKVRYAGCSNFAAWQTARALWAADKHGWARFESDQVQYSLLERGMEAELAPLAGDQGVGILAWSPLAGGYLTGKYKDGASPKGARLSDPATAFPWFEPARAARVYAVLEKVAQTQRATPAQTALAWTLSKPWVASAIVGVTSAAQLDEDLDAAAVTLSREALAFLDRASSL